MSGENINSLNEYLFRQLDRLDQADMGSPDEVRAEVDRARAVCQVGQTLVNSGHLMLKAAQESSMTGAPMPGMLSDGRGGRP